jgi:hypothetical protein
MNRGPGLTNKLKEQVFGHRVQDAQVTKKSRYDDVHQPLLTTAVSPGSKGFGLVTGTMTPVMK